jgi:hypothetical protein
VAARSHRRGRSGSCRQAQQPRSSTRGTPRITSRATFRVRSACHSTRASAIAVRLAKFRSRRADRSSSTAAARPASSRSKLGEALLKAGQKKVLVYTDGWPDWSQRNTRERPVRRRIAA